MHRREAAAPARPPSPAGQKFRSGGRAVQSGALSSEVPKVLTRELYVYELTRNFAENEKGRNPVSAKWTAKDWPDDRHDRPQH